MWITSLSHWSFDIQFPITTQISLSICGCSCFTCRSLFLSVHSFMEVSPNRRRRLDQGTGSSKGFKEFSKIKKEDDKRLSGLTLSAVLGAADTGIDENNKSWEAVKDNVRSHNSGAGWTPSVPVPTSDVMISRRNSGRSSPDDPKYDEAYPAPTSPRIRPELGSNPSSRSLMLRRNSSRVPSVPSGRYGRGVDFFGESEIGEGHRRNPSSSGDEEGTGDEETEEEEEEGGGGGKMSLMALLAETDREMGLDGATYMMDDDDDDEDEDDDDEDEDTSFYNSCSVCMVRHKGTSSTPCGHSFCRLCSKELYVQRGNCPKCNAYLMEILEVF